MPCPPPLGLCFAPAASNLTLAWAPALAPADWAVLGLYFAALLGMGVWSSLRKVSSTEDYFLASRSMPVWAVVLSILSTAQSAATYVGVPQSSYEGNLTYLSSNLGGLLAAVLLAVVFIPAFYRNNVSTPYQLLERRFGSTGRLAAAAAYLVGRVFASGARVFVAAIPAALVFYGDADHAGAQAAVIVGFTAVGIALCFVGGVRSVIWIDVLQVTVYVGAAVATIVVLLQRIPADIPTIVHGLANPPTGTSKLQVLSISTDPRAEFTLWTAITGFALLTIASHGTDQDLVQRMLTCKSPTRGAWSVISGVAVGVPAVTIFLVLGLLLHVFYQRPDLMAGAASAAGAAPGGGTPAFQAFALGELQGGLAGLVVAGLFACGPAGINSGLNAMASTFVGDIYRHVRPAQGPGGEVLREEAHYLRVGRLAVVGAGALLGGMALLCIAWYDPKDRTILGFVLSVMNFAYAGLLGVFFTALFTRRGTGGSVIAALVVGFLVVLSFQAAFWLAVAKVAPGLVGAATAADVNLDGVKSALPWLKWQYPWHLCVGAGAAFLVCALPGGRPPSPQRRN